MALRQMREDKEKKGVWGDDCPECRAKLLTIDGVLTQWKTCPNCKYRQLIRKGKEGPRVTSLR
ncbi:MAG: hypothetical protein ISS95_01405 [Candidatus Aenigmarchaeota archaeon]|nr:hypothetical protein [Candidatus Aenigmarchaeota archaeon]